MIYLAAGLVCVTIAIAYGVGLYRGYKIGYEDAVEEITTMVEEIKRIVNKNKTNET